MAQTSVGDSAEFLPPVILLWAVARAIFAGNDKRFDHVCALEVAVKLIQFVEPELKTVILPETCRRAFALISIFRPLPSERLPEIR